jgi:hypothetical protein
MRGIAVYALLASCAFRAGAAGGGDGGLRDGSGAGEGSPQLDAPTDSMLGACIVVPDLAIDLCPMNPAGGALEIAASVSLHTDDGTTMPNTPGIACTMMMGGSAPMVCAVMAATIKLDTGATLSAFGGKPLVLLATQSIDLEGTIDVASHVGPGGQVGAGQPHPGCIPGTNPNNDGGGQGGSYGTTAGNGGDADGAPGSGGSSGGILTIASLAGGCPGAPGDGGAMGGAGGGAVFLATPTLVIGGAGAIDASGASGRGGAAGKKGGGGGGSGGTIAITVGTLLLDAGAQLFANGGHGGGGSSASAGDDGTDPTGPASGGGDGLASGSGGAGGAGAFRGSAAVAGSAGTGGNDGGGGGGGGAGAIYIRPTTSDANISPAPI